MNFRIFYKFPKKLPLRKRLERIYDKLYAKADELVKEANPCKIRKGKDGNVTCIACRGRIRTGPPNILCCIGCVYHSPKGCKAEKPLTCKLWLCRHVENITLNKQLKKLDELLSRMGFYVERGDKTESINNAMSWFDHQDWSHTSIIVVNFIKKVCRKGITIRL